MNADRIVRTPPGQRKNATAEAYVVQTVHGPGPQQRTNQVGSPRQALLVLLDIQEGQRIRAFLTYLGTMSLFP